MINVFQMDIKTGKKSLVYKNADSILMDSFKSVITLTILDNLKPLLKFSIDTDKYLLIITKNSN